MRLDGKVVVVTGAESGIGRAIAKACAIQGASVVLSGLNTEGLSQSAAGMADGRTTICPVDIRLRASVDELFRHAMDHFGRIDAVVANAGVAPPKKPALEVTDEEWNSSISVNLTGTYNTVTAAGRILVAQGKGGSIIATGSSTAVRAMPGLLAYSAAKAGLHGLMRQLALELAPYKIRVNTLVPGTAATELARAMPGHLEHAATVLPMGEVVEPDELGRYVAFAISDAVPHMTGAMLSVDSGRTIA